MGDRGKTWSRYSERKAVVKAEGRANLAGPQSPQRRVADYDQKAENKDVRKKIGVPMFALYNLRQKKRRILAMPRIEREPRHVDLCHVDAPQPGGGALAEGA